MKKCLITLASLMLIVATTFALAGCSSANDRRINNNIGTKMPSLSPTKQVNATMSAYDMYLAVLENHNATPFVASHQSGDIITKPLGMTTTQALDVRKARKGNLYYMDNYTSTIKEILGINIKLMEETVIENGNIRYRVSDGCNVGENGVLTAKKWMPTAQYDSYDSLVAAKPNDPTKLFMYIANPDTIVSSIAPEFDKKTKQYTFTLTLDPAKANVDYSKVVAQQLENNGFKNPSLTFTKTVLEFIVWENGFIRGINISEAYKFKSSISGSSSMEARANFSYDESEMQLSKLIRF